LSSELNSLSDILELSQDVDSYIKIGKRGT